MSTATLDIDSVAATEETLQYRALHTGAILGFVLAILSIFTLLAAANSLEGCLLVAPAPIPVLGMFMSLRSWAKIRREPERYTGGAIAMAGFVLSLIFLLGSVSYSSYVYATEVPEGYTRISFNTVKPDALEERGGIAVPPNIAALDGKKVFIKGYIRPDSVTVSRGIDRFLLVRDNNQCCFGNLSTVKYHDQVLVTMVGSRRVDYSDGVLRMGGILKVEPQNVARAPLAPVFSLQADYAN
jgi:hypothetical protein